MEAQRHDLDCERERQVAHARERLLERYGIASGPAGLETLAACIERRRARWRHHGAPGPLRVDSRRQEWWRVAHWTGREIVCCYDPVTRMIRTVVERLEAHG